MFNPFTLEGKNIIVTGASSGIGRQCAIDCSKMGAKVVLIARNKERLEETSSMMDGNEHLMIPFDLTNFEGISSVVNDIVNHIGKISGVLHCAGISAVNPLQVLSPKEMRDFFDINVTAAMMLTKEVCRKKNIFDKGGSIVFFSSVMGVCGESGKSLYSMTKGALIAGARSLACEYAPKAIRMNCVSPGAIETPINAQQPYMSNPELRKQLEDKHLLGLGQTTDISNACIYLLSDASRWVTGQNLIIDGGYTIQ